MQNNTFQDTVYEIATGDSWEVAELHNDRFRLARYIARTSKRHSTWLKSHLW